MVFLQLLLASEVLFSIELAAVISAAGFVVLLCVFTSSDIALTLLGTLAMFVIIAISICIHEYFFPGDFDLLDIVVLIAIMGMAVDFPIHYLMEFIISRQHYHTKKENEDEDEDNDGERSNSTINNSGSGRSQLSSFVGSNPNYIPPQEALDHSQHSPLTPTDPNPNGNNSGGGKKEKFFPPLKTTMKYMTASLIAPLILTFLSGFPLLYAEFQLLRKCGQYIIILAVVSYVYCVFSLAYLMQLGCTLKACDKICLTINPEAFRILEINVDDEEDEREVRRIATSQRASPLTERLIRREESSRASSSRNGSSPNRRQDRGSTSSDPIVLTTAEYAIVIPTTEVLGVVPLDDQEPMVDVSAHSPLLPTSSAAAADGTTVTPSSPIIAYHVD